MPEPFSAFGPTIDIGETEIQELVIIKSAQLLPGPVILVPASKVFGDRPYQLVKMTRVRQAIAEGKLSVHLDVLRWVMVT